MRSMLELSIFISANFLALASFDGLKFPHNLSFLLALLHSCLTQNSEVLKCTTTASMDEKRKQQSELNLKFQLMIFAYNLELTVAVIALLCKATKIRIVY